MDNKLHPHFLMEKFGYPQRGGPKTAEIIFDTQTALEPQITSDSQITSSTRPEQLQTIQQEALELFTKKNADYGDAFATYGTVGVIVRIGDKISRLTSITSSKVQLVDDEGMRDTLIDLHNYAAMAIMLLDEKKTE